MTNYLSNIFVEVYNAIHIGVSSVITDPNWSYALAIILFTILAKVILMPLSWKQMKSTTKMTMIQGDVQKLQDKFKNDPQRQQQEMMKLYKEHGVNPLGGCLPLLIQWPILIALFYVFNKVNYNGAGFLWISSLTAKDPYFILPIISGLTTYISSKTMQMGSPNNTQSKTTSTMNIAMAVVFGFMSLNFPAALVLYWITSNIVQMVQTYFIQKSVKKSMPAASMNESGTVVNNNNGNTNNSGNDNIMNMFGLGKNNNDKKGDNPYIIHKDNSKKKK